MGLVQGLARSPSDALASGPLDHYTLVVRALSSMSSRVKESSRRLTKETVGTVSNLRLIFRAHISLGLNTSSNEAVMEYSAWPGFIWSVQLNTELNVPLTWSLT